MGYYCQNKRVKQTFDPGKPINWISQRLSLNIQINHQPKQDLEGRISIKFESRNQGKKCSSWGVWEGTLSPSATTVSNFYRFK